MKKLFAKYPIVKDILVSYMYSLLYSCVFVGVIFGVLELTGLYRKLERVLDLKYNSPFILIPLYGFATIAILSFVIGFLLYFYKYKRSKAKSTFYKTYSNILYEKQSDKE